MSALILEEEVGVFKVELKQGDDALYGHGCPKVLLYVLFQSVVDDGNGRAYLCYVRQCQLCIASVFCLGYSYYIYLYYSLLYTTAHLWVPLICKTILIYINDE